MGIDTPEMDECFGMEAKPELEGLLADQPIRLDKDVTVFDKYDRLLWYLFIVNEEEE